MDDGMDTLDALHNLTFRELLERVRGQLAVPHFQRASKTLLVSFIRHNAECDLLAALEASANSLVAGERTTRSRKRKRDPSFARSVRPRVGGDNESSETSQFLVLPSAEEARQCTRDFFAATSQPALASSVCAVCARECGPMDEKTSVLPLRDVPNRHRLRPVFSHPAHDLLEGLLLEPAGVCQASSGAMITVCSLCLHHLRDIKRTGPPRLALANGLWVGRVPWALQMLSFAEQLLVALLYPRVYVFKLFPKKFGGVRSAENLQRGMRGNVSTYELNMEGITSMLSGHLMPRPPRILASLISITFIGVGPLPRNWMGRMFRVRRRVVADALMWLKANNPGYYGHILIDTDRLQLLPEDDVPIEIGLTVRHSTDDGVVDQESAGYVPEEEEEFDLGPDGEGTSDGQPDVIPLQSSGSMDCDLTTISPNELMSWGVANLQHQCSQEGGYAVRHAPRPVQDFVFTDTTDVNRQNIFEKAFPCLFPYGFGGIESRRMHGVDFLEHVRWALRYHDRRFRLHETFPFLAFGIYQRRQALSSARVQIHRREYDRDLPAMSRLSLHSLQEAARDEEAGRSVTDPGILALKKHTYAAAGRVLGSDQSRYQLRSQIWSTTIRLGPPSLWITINPCDLHDPIVQVFAGENIDMDNLEATVGPDKEQRAVNVARDPYAAAKFFHFLIATVFETLFGVHAGPFDVCSRKGIFGRITAYFGTVEAQGRGSLHLHLLLYLHGVPSPSRMQELLQQDTFRHRILAFIKANLRAHLPGIETEDSFRQIPNAVDVAWCRPPHPNVSDEEYTRQRRSLEYRVVRAKQLHTCAHRRCLVPDKHGRYRCKRHARFPLSPRDVVDEHGNWNPKRLLPFLNGWIPDVTVDVRCNNDGKLLTNGEDTNDVSFYVTTYPTKKQGKTFNVSAVMAKGYSHHLDREHDPTYGRSLRDDQRLMLFRVVHAINREQELSAPMVISYLMGWGDVKRSHHYTPVYWSTFVRALLHEFPGLRSHPENADEATHTIINDHDMTSTTLDITSSGRLYVKSQLIDYAMRGDALDSVSLMDYFADTYETSLLPSTPSRPIHPSSTRGRGRPRHTRVRYQADHPSYLTKERIIRPPGHNTIPNFIGQYFPSNTDADEHAFYSACMLMLFKPWRTLSLDLKRQGETWNEAFLRLTALLSPHQQFMMDNIQYFHQCKASVTSRQTEDPTEIGETCAQGGDNGWDAEDDYAFDDELMDHHVLSREQLHGWLAVEAAKLAGVFPTDEQDLPSSTHPHTGPRLATETDLANLRAWQAQLDSECTQTSPVVDETDADVILAHSSSQNFSSSATVSPVEAEKPLEMIDDELLNIDQRRAYDIVCWHLARTLDGHSPPPLRMIVNGEGGVGKSQVIQSITAHFHSRNVDHLLTKNAYTGVAASLIEGQTCHSAAMISRKEGPPSPAARAKLQQAWKRVAYDITDEFSMLGKTFFARMSLNISIGKLSNETISNAFADLNVILFGDPHQFPPVGCSIHEALFFPTDSLRDSTLCQIGRETYLDFTTVVTLKQQIRVIDPVWSDFLRHLRCGVVQEHHLEMLHRLVLSHPECSIPDFASPPWNHAMLITPRHGVRTEWNSAAIRKHCHDQQQSLVVSHAEDRISGRALLPGEAAVLSHHLSTSKRQGTFLPTSVELAIGMRVMVTRNLDTDLDITNGARGTVIDIVLPTLAAPQSNARHEVHVSGPPAYILVRLDRTRACGLDDLEPNVVPILPVQKTCRITLDDGQKTKKTVYRSQLPITPAYACTDYRAQGQTIPAAVIDIATPPTGGLNLFNLYVALSRGKGRETIRLLREFDDKHFKMPQLPELALEDERLERLNHETLAWWNTIAASGTSPGDR